MKLLVAVVAAITMNFTGATAAQAARFHNYEIPSANANLEGIGYDYQADLIYVSNPGDGTIYRAPVDDEELEVWKPGGTDGRTSVLGIDVDRNSGRVYLAGGATAKVFIYEPDGTLVASLQAPSDATLNDVWVSDDGAAYITDSSKPRIFKVSQNEGSWSIKQWLDASDVIPAEVGPNVFNLNGIVETPDGRYLLTPQSSTGVLWRINKSTKEITAVDLGGGNVENGDGIVLRGHTLYAIQNFSHLVSAVRLSGDFSHGKVKGRLQTSPDRTFTTAKLVHGHLLAVDSQFNQQPPFPTEDRVVTLPKPR